MSAESDGDYVETEAGRVWRCGTCFEQFDDDHYHDIIAHAWAHREQKNMAQYDYDEEIAQIRLDLDVAERLTGTQDADSTPGYYDAVRRVFAFARKQLPLDLPTEPGLYLGSKAIDGEASVFRRTEKGTWILLETSSAFEESHLAQFIPFRRLEHGGVIE